MRLMQASALLEYKAERARHGGQLRPHLCTDIEPLYFVTLINLLLLIKCLFHPLHLIYSNGDEDDQDTAVTQVRIRVSSNSSDCRKVQAWWKVHATHKEVESSEYELQEGADAISNWHFWNRIDVRQGRTFKR